MRQKSETILVISTMYPSRRHPSFGIFIKNQTTELRNLGYHIDLVVVKHPGTQKLMLVIKYVNWFLKIAWKLITKGRAYQIVHAHYVFPSGMPALLFKKLFKSKMVVTVHGGDLNKMALKSPLLFKATKKILQSADDVIAVGMDLKRKLIQNYEVDKQNIHLLNMGVDRTYFTPLDQTAAKDALQLSPDSSVLLFVGNLIPAKGIAELIEAFADIKQGYPTMTLHLVGAEKTAGYVQELIQRQTDSDVRQAISVHPPQTQQIIANWMNAADLLVLPSHMEGFGLVALEAMACHTPVVGTCVGGLKHLLGEGTGVIVEPGKIAELSRGIQSVFEDDSFRSSLIINGEEKAQMFDQVNIIKRLETIYLE